MQLDEKKNSLVSIFLKILCLFVSKTYQILFVQFGMYFVFGWEEKFAINTYHILIIHFGMYKEKKLTEFCLNFTYQMLFAQFGMYICVRRENFTDYLHTKV